MQDNDIFAIDNPLAAEPDTHARTQRLGVQHPIWERIGN
jgi:hypothetical protein